MSEDSGPVITITRVKTQLLCKGAEYELGERQLHCIYCYNDYSWNEGLENW
jgi:hypothetical protein